MKTMICIGALLLTTCLIGCGHATPTSETYSVEAKQTQLTTGRKNEVEISVQYHRSKQPAAKLSYRVQFSGPPGLAVSPTSWDVQQNLTTNDAGFYYNGIVTIEVANDAEPGEREVTITITPDHGTASTKTMKFQVVREDN